MRNASIPQQIPQSPEHAPRENRSAEFIAAYDRVATLLEGMNHPTLIPGIAAMVLAYSFPDKDWKYEPGHRLGIQTLLERTFSRVEGFRENEDLQAAFREQLVLLKDLGALRLESGCYLIPCDPSHIKSRLLKQAVFEVTSLLARVQAQDLATASAKPSAAPPSPRPARSESRQDLLTADTFPIPALELNRHDPRALRRIAPFKDRLLYVDARAALQGLTPEFLRAYPVPATASTKDSSALIPCIRSYLLDCVLRGIAEQRPDLAMKVFKAPPGGSIRLSHHRAEVQSDGMAFRILEAGSGRDLGQCHRLVRLSQGNNACIQEFRFPGSGELVWQLPRRAHVPSLPAGELLQTTASPVQLALIMTANDFDYMMKNRPHNAGLGRTFARDLADNSNRVIVLNVHTSEIADAAKRILRNDPAFIKRQVPARPIATLSEHAGSDAQQFAFGDRSRGGEFLSHVYRYVDDQLDKLVAITAGREDELEAMAKADPSNASLTSLVKLLNARSEYVSRLRRTIGKITEDFAHEDQGRVCSLIKRCIGMDDPLTLPDSLEGLRASPLGEFSTARLRLSRLVSGLRELKERTNRLPDLNDAAAVYNRILKEQLESRAGTDALRLYRIMRLDGAGLRP